MTKRILSVLAMMSIAAMMMLSSCTAAGVECGLIGKWEYVNGSDDYKRTIEITADDQIISVVNDYDYQYDSATGNEVRVEKEVETKGTIEEVTGKAIIYKVKDSTVKSVLEYSDLNGDTVKFQGGTFKKVN